MTSRHGLAITCRLAGRLAQAIELQETTLADREKILMSLDTGWAHVVTQGGCPGPDFVAQAWPNSRQAEGALIMHERTLHPATAFNRLARADSA